MNLRLSIDISLAIAGMNRRQLAESIGLTPGAISLMAARGTCSSVTIEKMAKAFDVKESEFIARGEA